MDPAPGAGNAGSRGYDADERATLLELARASVRHTVCTGSALEARTFDFSERLREVRSCFVTLRSEGVLRGCTGRLEASRPLVVDVAFNAHRAALRDPRFHPVREHELAGLEVHVSVLTPLLPLPASSEAELLAALVPGRTGLVLREGERAATFLPAVWQQLEDPRDFLRELRHKAGLPPDHWSATLRFERYEAEEVG